MTGFTTSFRMPRIRRDDARAVEWVPDARLEPHDEQWAAVDVEPQATWMTEPVRELDLDGEPEADLEAEMEKTSPSCTTG